MSVYIRPHSLHGIVAHAREGSRREICGILRGRAEEATQLTAPANLVADKIDNYDVDPQTLLKQFEL